MKTYGKAVILAGWLALLIITCSNTQARVGPASLADMSNGSNYITLAHVESVKSINGVKIASVLTEKVFKGRFTNSRFYVLAEPTWQCDISEAIPGERVLLFLNPTKNSVVHFRFGYRKKAAVRISHTPLFSIAHSGRGRMPLRKIKGKDYITVYTYGVTLPSNIKTVNGPNPKEAEYMRSALLQDIVTALPFKSAKKVTKRN